MIIIPLHAMDFTRYCSAQAQSLVNEIRQRGSDQEKIIARHFVTKLIDPSFQNNHTQEGYFFEQVNEERAKQPNPRYASIAAILAQCKNAFSQAHIHAVQTAVDKVISARDSVSYFEWHCAYWWRKRADTDVLYELFDYASAPFAWHAYKGLLQCNQPEQVQTLYAQASRICDIKQQIRGNIFPQNKIQFPLAIWDVRPGCMAGFIALDTDINPTQILQEAIYSDKPTPNIITSILKDYPEFCDSKHLLSVLNGLSWNLYKEEKIKFFTVLRDQIQKCLRENNRANHHIFHEYAELNPTDLRKQFHWLIENQYNPNEEKDGLRVLDIVVAYVYRSINPTTQYTAQFLENIKYLISKGATLKQDHTAALQNKKKWFDQTAPEFEGLRTSLDTRTYEAKQESKFIQDLLDQLNSIQKERNIPEIVISVN